MMDHWGQDIAKRLTMSTQTLEAEVRDKVYCRRKAVGCKLVQVTRIHDEIMVDEVHMEHNNPLPHTACTFCADADGEVRPGRCAGVHAEQKLALWITQEKWMVEDHRDRANVILCSYSPCTACANILCTALDMLGLDKSKWVVLYETLTEHDTRGVNLLQGNDVRCISLHEREEIARFLIEAL